MLLTTIYSNETGRYFAENDRDDLSKPDNWTPMAGPQASATDFTARADLLPSPTQLRSTR